MHPNKGYHLGVRRRSASAVAVLGMALLAPLSPAQVRGTPAPDSHQTSSRSSTVNAAPARHTGVMPTPAGVSPLPAPAFPTPTPIGVPPTLPVPGADVRPHPHHHHPNAGFVGGAYPVYVPVPVVVEPYPLYQSAPDQADDESDDTVVPGPTVFERRSPDDMSEAADDSDPATVPAPPMTPEQPQVTAPPADSSVAAQPARPQPTSVLVFRDGHQLEVENYAIVGDMLYDFTPGHPRKVPLSQLDLDATVKANDDRGVDFVLPSSAKGE
ncbi:MAG TPA: hypothetical protein VKT29_14440 [Terriglobales bacterium]|nr:hypothetical protein [Terriglobales bacterium]